MDLLFVKIWQTGNNISELLFFFFLKKCLLVARPELY